MSRSASVIVSSILLLASAASVAVAQQPAASHSTMAKKKAAAHAQIKKTHNSGMSPDAVGPSDKASPLAEPQPTATPTTPPK